MSNSVWLYLPWLRSLLHAEYVHITMAIMSLCIYIVHTRHRGGNVHIYTCMCGVYIHKFLH